MTLEQRITEDMKTAMKAKDQNRLRGVRAVKSAILLAKTEKGGGEGLSEEQEIKMLQKLVKQRQESMELFEKQGREDLALREKQEIEVIETYLPQPLNEEELNELVKTAIQETGASGMQDMGRVMGTANAMAAGRVDGKTLSDRVKQFLQSS